jgi:flagella basal body P-ring formation protein FlgA
MKRSLLLLAAMLAAPAAASERPTLRPTVVVASDVVTIGDLLGEGAPSASTALFRAPEAGSYGTIQAWRAAEAVRAHGIQIEVGAIAEVRVERTARTVGEIELTDAVAREAIRRFELDDRARVELRVESPAGVASLDASSDATLLVERFAHDPATNRFEAMLIAVEPSGRRSRPIRVTGTAIELVDMMRLRRAVGRGDIVNASDVMIERMPRSRLPSDIVMTPGTIIGYAARRPMQEGTVLRSGDLERPRVIARNDQVTILVESGNLTVTARGRALDGGSVGDSIEVQNVGSRRTLQATILGPGRVAVRTGQQRRNALTAAAQTPAVPAAQAVTLSR